jgi:hypothetical protein
MINKHRDLNIEKIYSEINVTNFGCIIAYLALVCLQNDNEESIRHNIQKTIEACRIFSIPKHKPSKRPILITLSLTLIALYTSSYYRKGIAAKCRKLSVVTLRNFSVYSGNIYQSMKG